MHNKSLAILLVAGSLFAATSAQADHNSVWGAGHANMPNDIHNSAIEDDQDVFLDLVQQGGGADSVNRYDTEDTDVTDTSVTDRDTGSRSDVTDRRVVDRTDMTSRAGGGGSMSRGGSRR